VEVFEIFHFVFGAWRIKELDDFGGEAHVLVACIDIRFKILFSYFIEHELVVFFLLIFRDYLFNNVED
jgi:hypothetical protein